jgi:hypothetical protein
MQFGFTVFCFLHTIPTASAKGFGRQVICKGGEYHLLAWCELGWHAPIVNAAGVAPAAPIAPPPELALPLAPVLPPLPPPVPVLEQERAQEPSAGEKCTLGRFERWFWNKACQPCRDRASRKLGQ